MAARYPIGLSKDIPRISGKYPKPYTNIETIVIKPSVKKKKE